MRSARIEIVLLLAGCAGSSGDSGAESQDCSLYGYELAAEPVLTTWCTPCHSSAMDADSRQGAPEDVNFDSYEGASAHADAIVQWAVEAREMPPAGEVPEGELDQLGAWVACGAGP